MTTSLAYDPDADDWLLLSGRAQRRARVRMLARLRHLSRRKGAAMCQTALSGVTVAATSNGISHVRGIQRCASAWSCPVCAPVIRHNRAREIDEGLATHFADGGSALMLTLTIRHTSKDSLASLLEALTDAWRRVQRRVFWKQARDSGITGQIRTLEITWSERNGWHPHLHLLLLTAPNTFGPMEQFELRESMTEHWADAVMTVHGRTVSAKHSVDLRPADNPSAVGSYLTKLSGSKWSIGHEMARGDRKRSQSGYSPFEILTEAMYESEKDSQLFALWDEYEQATMGRSSIRWSRGLREHLQLVELTDEEAAVEQLDEEVAADNKVIIAPDVWNAAVHQGRQWELVEAIEDWAVLGYCGDPPVGRRLLTLPVAA